jgi:hypothetical protein
MATIIFLKIRGRLSSSQGIGICADTYSLIFTREKAHGERIVGAGSITLSYGL